MSMVSAGLKKIRKTLHLPPVTVGNVATKYLPVAATVASFGGLGPLASAAGKVGSIASKIPGAGVVGKVYNTLKGNGGTTNIGGYDVPTGGYDYSNIADKISGNSGSFIDDALGVVKGVRKATGAKPITLKNTLGGALKKVGGGILDSITNHPLETAGAAAAAANAASAYKRAGDYEQKGINLAEQSYNERAPLRKRGVDGMLAQTAQAPQDFTNSANPFARKRKVSV